MYFIYFVFRYTTKKHPLYIYVFETMANNTDDGMSFGP